MGPGSRLTLALVAIVLLMSVATLSYVLVEGMGFVDALFMTVITLTTVGFGEQLTTVEGRVLTIVVMLIAVVLVAVALSSLTEILVAGSIARMMGRKRMEKQLKALSDHYVICGYGRIGQMIARDLRAHQVPFVVIEASRAAVEDDALDQGFLYVEGDATEDDVLLSAGIERAKGLVTSLPSNAQNAFVTMSARELAPHLTIIARAAEEGAERKLVRAGADRVVSPYEIGARRMAQCILQPSVIDFIELVTLLPEEGAMVLSEVKVHPGSDLVDTTLLESQIRAKHSSYVVALKPQGRKMDMNPPPTARISAGDVLVLIGPSEGIQDLEARAHPEGGTG